MAMMMMRARTKPDRGIEDPEKSKGPATFAVTRPRQVTPLGKGRLDEKNVYPISTLGWMGYSGKGRDYVQRGSGLELRVGAVLVRMRLAQN